MAPRRLIVIDECLDWRLALELRKRNWRARSNKELGTERLLDGPMLRKLASMDDKHWVLVTADDDLPAEHGPQLHKLGATVATIDSRWREVVARHGGQYTQEQFKRDSVHRWAHQIAALNQGSVVRCTPYNVVRWTSRKKYAA